MKFLIITLCFSLLGPIASAVEKCTARDLKEDITSIWFISGKQPQVHFSDAADGPPTKKYVVQGDLLLANQETASSVCASYVKKNKVVAFGWLKKSEIEKFDLVSFGAFDVDGSQKNIDPANAALKALAEKLPEVKNWQGTWQDKYKNSVKIWKKGSSLKLSTMGIAGVIGTGNDDDDAVDLTATGALAQEKEDPKVNDVCDKVIVGFNNALLATSGSHCLGSGANHEYPEFSGIYWKK